MRRELFLAAESAARGRLDHPDARFVAAERVLQRLEHVVRALHRALHHEDAALQIGDHPLGLQVHVLLGAGLVRAGDDHRGASERALYVAFLDL